MRKFNYKRLTVMLVLSLLMVCSGSGRGTGA